MRSRLQRADHLSVLRMLLGTFTIHSSTFVVPSNFSSPKAPQGAVQRARGALLCCVRSQNKLCLTESKSDFLIKRIRVPVPVFQGHSGSLCSRQLLLEVASVFHFLQERPDSLRPRIRARDLGSHRRLDGAPCSLCSINHGDDARQRLYILFPVLFVNCLGPFTGFT